VEKRIANPPDMVFIVIAVAGGLVILSLAIFSLAIVTSDPFAFSLLVFSGICLIMISIWTQLVQRPISIVVRDDLLSLVYRNGRMRSIPFSTIQWVYAYPYDPKSLVGKMFAQGHLKVKGMWIMPLTKEAAMAIKEGMPKKIP